MDPKDKELFNPDDMQSEELEEAYADLAWQEGYDSGFEAGYEQACYDVQKEKKDLKGK